MRRELVPAPARTPDEPAAVYGYRLLLWLLAAPGASVAVLDDAAVGLAAAAGARASAGRYEDARVYDRLAAIRRELLAAERRRARAVAGDAGRSLFAAGGLAGPGGPREPIRPGPSVNPAGPGPAAYADDDRPAAEPAGWGRRVPAVDVAF